MVRLGSPARSADLDEVWVRWMREPIRQYFAPVISPTLTAVDGDI